jgi:lysophospholipase L1-like esterase
MATFWVSSDVAAISEAMLVLGGPAVDLRPVFAGGSGAQLILDDGVHPSLEGQKAILREIVAKLAAG